MHVHHIHAIESVLRSINDVVVIAVQCSMEFPQLPGLEFPDDLMNA